MKKKTILFLIISLSVIITELFYIPFKATSDPILTSRTDSTKTLENELIITILTPHIFKAIEDYYGEYRQFDIFNSKIENIEKVSNGENVFKVRIFIITFVGPHNPPYGYDTITFTVTPFLVTMDKYNHRDEEISVPMSQ